MARMKSCTAPLARRSWRTDARGPVELRDPLRSGPSDRPSLGDSTSGFSQRRANRELRARDSFFLVAVLSLLLFLPSCSGRREILEERQDASTLSSQSFFVSAGSEVRVWARILADSPGPVEVLVVDHRAGAIPGSTGDDLWSPRVLEPGDILEINWVALPEGSYNLIASPVSGRRGRSDTLQFRIDRRCRGGSLRTASFGVWSRLANPSWREANSPCDLEMDGGA